jgi:cyclophilin family peptidyl-prolyl cis-trans isomerase
VKRRLGGGRFLGVNTRARGRALTLAACAALSLLALSCGGAETGTKDFDVDTASNVRKGVKPEPDAEAAVLETTFGRVVIELYPNLAPKMVERFKTLAKEGFYNGTAFHRVNPQAGVVQGGDPNSKDDDPSNDGMGGSPLPDLPAEFSDIPYERGVVGAARSSAPDSANSQFYITLRRVPQWDGQYTVFGRVIEGMGNADVIAGAPTRPGTENPADKVVIQSITFQPRANFK